MARVKKERKVSAGEQKFINYWDILGSTAYNYVREYKFHPAVGWRFDFAWIVERDESGWCQKVAVEIEGGVMNGGRHVRPKGYSDDLLKYNEAVLLGWQLLRFTIQQLDNDPLKCINQVLQLLDAKEAL